MSAGHLTRLPSGLIVATVEMPHMASVSLGLWVAVGGRYEPEKLNGVSHFIEHLLFKGTAKRSAREISEAVEGIGGSLNAYTCEDHTCFFARACCDRWPVLLEVLTDMLLHSRFAPSEIEKERGVIKEEIAMDVDQPQEHVFDLLNEVLWPEHPLGRRLTGTEKSINGISRAQMLAYRREHYVAGASLIVAAGCIEHDALVKRVRRFESGFPTGARPVFEPVKEVKASPQVRLLKRDTAQSQLALGIRTCSRHDPRRFALRLLSTLLGENMSSRLFQVVREDRGLAYSIHSNVTLFDDVGALTIAAGLDAEQIPAVMKLVLRELWRLIDKDPPVAELRQARDYVVGQLELGLESTENQMMWIGEQIFACDRIVPADEYKQELLGVTSGHIRRVARCFFQPQRMCAALISSSRLDQGLGRMLRKF